ncbi:hypothetical protein STRPS_0016 [Streptococcus pseudoporcinus LQ 940-04]|uniref:Uncharacterized protein n=1 Tax=Streptococcus pseudoporcinus LQ 940-04 TaxID=875093 RepID=G5K774_9STRE|nr:hypothetical protein HMPREF9320_2067 [Streptococcus pseudoporcinus SPIN 20026]EHI65784.1 hypothetical protein STRPS_0016 [Streptococcus pseudoporcinus LQ 940-04]
MVFINLMIFIYNIYIFSYLVTDFFISVYTSKEEQKYQAN